MIPTSILERKGARKVVDIPKQVLDLLNEGKIETVNLTEWLAVDQLVLLKHALTEIDAIHIFQKIESAVKSIKKPTSNAVCKTIGLLLFELCETKSLEKLATHTSDTVRCWSCWALTADVNDTKALIEQSKPFAADTHFGVREVIIFTVKERLAADLDVSLKALQSFTTSEDENVRRFAVEVCRPIGVWTKSIPALKEHPEKASVLLTALKDDPSRYVQNAVANWLNDASKSRPDWVNQLFSNWNKTEQSKAQNYIIKRGLRTLEKQKKASKV